MIENIDFLSREEKLNRLRDSVIKNHVNYLYYVPSTEHKDVNWKVINPILEKIVDYISEISDVPVFEKYSKIQGQNDTTSWVSKSYSVESYDFTSVGHIDSFISNIKYQDVVFYSLMELDTLTVLGHKRVIFRGLLYKNLERIKRENRDQRIDEIIE